MQQNTTIETKSNEWRTKLIFIKGWLITIIKVH